MRTHPTVSVVIPTYNRAKMLAQAVASVLAQTVPATEILVIDDGSTDDTVERLAPFCDRVRYLPQRNQGVSAARNHGISAARGELIAFLDSDDIWHPRKLEMQLQALKSHTEVGLIGAETFAWPTPTIPNIPDDAHIAFEPVSWEAIVVRNPLVASAVLVRRFLLEQAGPFDTRLQGPEDCDLWLRIAALTPAGNLRVPLVGYRQVTGSVSKQADTCRRGMLLILRKLDEQQAWNGRWLLRRKAYSSVHHTCAFLYGAAGRYGTAALLSARSLLSYPLPYQSREVLRRWERPKRLALNLLRLLGLRAGEPPLAPADGPEEVGQMLWPTSSEDWAPAPEVSVPR